MGVVTAIGHDIETFGDGLRAGRCGIASLRRIPADKIPIKIGAEIRDWDWRQRIEAVEGGGPGFCTRARKLLNRAPDSVRLSACAAAQAIGQSQLLGSALTSDRVGLIVAGSNLHQRYIHENGGKFCEEPEYISPTYALSFLDTSQVGCLSELFGIHGMGYTVGGASASGNVALYQAWEWIRAGVLDACVVVGASPDFSEVELQGFSILGAACGEPYQVPPEQSCRPFDRDRAGFVLGEGSGCVVLENLDSACHRAARVLGELKGASMVLDGNSRPNPTLEGELKAMKMALRAANVDVTNIGYINAHGSSSVLGDQVECEAIASLLPDPLASPPINSTKSLTGHCIYAAGVIEFIACAIQMNEGFLHPNLNLANPLDHRLNFAGATTRVLDAKFALSNGFGFGGFNSSLVLERGGS
jgi:malonyl-ACP decarboxylase